MRCERWNIIIRQMAERSRNILNYVQYEMPRIYERNINTPIIDKWLLHSLVYWKGF